MKQLACLALVLAACGGPSQTGDDDGFSDAAPPAASHHGFVTISGYNTTLAGQPVVGGSVTANFAVNPACAAHVIGNCTVADCTASAATYTSAGPLTITGLHAPVTLTPNATKMYGAYSTQSTLFVGGEQVMVSTPGADVGGFTATLTTPTKPTLTSPIIAPSGMLLISRTHDFTASWAPTNATIVVSVSGQGSVGVGCRFDGAAGSGTVPAAALATLTPGQGGFGINAVTTATATAGDWDVTVQGWFTGVYPDGSLGGGGTTVQ